jgi:hypothetical protein
VLPFRLTRSIALAALALAVALPVPASAQGFFEMLFGGRPQRNYETQYSNAYADPGAPDPQRPVESAPSTGRVVTYCVRTCDGRYFPMQRYANASPAQLCNTFCPASKTQVYTGSDINYAVAPNGTRYGEAENAFLYRKQVVPGCTCNGRDAFGLAPVDPANDPTLRAGDIVVTAEGPMSFKGNKWTRAALDIRTAVPPPAAPAEAIEPGDQAVNKD